MSVYVDPRNDSAPKPVLFKFAQPSERADTVVAEATALTLASELGMRVPAHEVESFNDVPALSIDRFDRGAGLQGPVYHCVSTATALEWRRGLLRKWEPAAVRQFRLQVTSVIGRACNAEQQMASTQTGFAGKDMGY